ncbi:MAG TPA: prolipoprotein diacylglyceryl transferase [Rugosimonospora sp.]|nr:prolipoprotein diacylglyceryl transferase [Rugosimonospora sp.]
MKDVLAAIPSPTSAAWQLGPLALRAYALCIILGIVVACWITERRMRRRGAPPYLVLDVAIWAVPAGIVGARVYSLITSPQEYFGKGISPLEPLEIWHGGLGIWGAVAGGVGGAWIACRMKGVPLTFVMDAAAPALPVAQAIGRWGNWFNNELYGRATSLPWGVRIHEMDPQNPGHALVMDGKPVVLGTFQPTFLYESLWNVGVAVLVWLLDRRYRFGRGRAFALYVMAYTVGRFWVEYLRVDTANHFLGLRLNDWIALLVFACALVYFLRIRGPQDRLEVAEGGEIQVIRGDAPAQAAAPEAAESEAGEPEAGTGEPVPAEATAEAKQEADAKEEAKQEAEVKTEKEKKADEGDGPPGEESSEARSSSAADR